MTIDWHIAGRICKDHSGFLTIHQPVEGIRGAYVPADDAVIAKTPDIIGL